MAGPIVTLTTDFGTADTYVGQMKGAVLAANPGCTLVDITHDVPAHDVRGGAFLLETGFEATPTAGAVMDLASAREVKLMPIPDDGLKRMQEFNPGYRRGIIPKGTYPKQTQDVPTVEYATHFIVRCELDDQFVYDVLDAIHGGLEDLAAIAKAIQKTSPETMGKDIGVPMHPGAARWYQEKGVS